MVRLNKIRVNLKHYGVQPGKAAIDQDLAAAARFFAANTRLVFDVDYDQMSMADVIEQEMCELVRKAETANAGGDHVSAMVALSDACELLLLPRSSHSWPPSPLRFGHNIDIHAGDRRFLAQYIGAVTEAVIALQAAARVTTLAIDYAAYLRFVSLIPIHVDTLDGHFSSTTAASAEIVGRSRPAARAAALMQPAGLDIAIQL